MQAAPGYLELLRTNPAYRSLWLGSVVSFCGDWFSTIALYEIVMELSDSGQMVAGVLIAKTLPIFLVSPLAGPLVDRMDRRTLLLVTDVLRALLTPLLILASWMGSLPLMFAALVARVLCSGVFIPARSAAIPDVTEEHELPVAMALSGGTWSVMLAIGAAMGGLATTLVGANGALVIDGLTFLLSAVFLWGLPALPPGDREEADSASFVDGLRLLARRPDLAALVTLKPGLSLASGSLVMLPIYGKDVFAGGAAYVGWLYTSRGLGALVGSMGVRRVIGDSPAAMRWGLVGGFAVLASALIAMGWAPSIGWACFGFFVGAIGNGVVWVYSSVMVQQRTLSSERGRIFAIDFGVMMLLSATVSYVAGAAVDWGYTPRQVMTVTGTTLIVPGLLWVIAMGLVDWSKGEVTDG